MVRRIWRYFRVYFWKARGPGVSLFVFVVVVVAIVVPNYIYIYYPYPFWGGPEKLELTFSPNIDLTKCKLHLLSKPQNNATTLSYIFQYKNVTK